VFCAEIVQEGNVFVRRQRLPILIDGADLAEPKVDDPSGLIFSVKDEEGGQAGQLGKLPQDRRSLVFLADVLGQLQQGQGLFANRTVFDRVDVDIWQGISIHRLNVSVPTGIRQIPFACPFPSCHSRLKMRGVENLKAGKEEEAPSVEGVKKVMLRRGVFAQKDQTPSYRNTLQPSA